jgi:hypothetical protein
VYEEAVVGVCELLRCCVRDLGEDDRGEGGCLARGGAGGCVLGEDSSSMGYAGAMRILVIKDSERLLKDVL